MKISDTPEEDSVSNPDIPTASLSAEVLSRKPFASVTDQMQPKLYTIHETSADFDEEASMANMEIGGNDEQPDIDIGLGSVPEYTKYYEPGV